MMTTASGNFKGSRQENMGLHDIGRVIRPFRVLVLGHADHFPNSLFIECPVHYHKLLCKIFRDPDIFLYRNGIARIIQYLHQDSENQYPDL